MKIFISWSGSESLAIATSLRSWLPTVLTSTKPWISNKDIPKGGKWRSSIAEQLRDAGAGIVCVTAANQGSEWLNFEAGAISKLDESLLCTFLRGIAREDVRDPLAQFQHTDSGDKDDVLGMLRSLNAALGEHRVDDAVLVTVFERAWPELEGSLSKIPSGGPPPSVGNRIELAAKAEQLERENLRLLADLEKTRKKPGWTPSPEGARVLESVLKRGMKTVTMVVYDDSKLPGIEFRLLIQDLCRNGYVILNGDFHNPFGIELTDKGMKYLSDQRSKGTEG